jgi:hypothetical protein
MGLHKQEVVLQKFQSNLLKLSIDPEVSYRSLTMVPLTQTEISNLKYDTLDEAMESGICDVEEVSENGSIPTLKFQNRGDTSVFLLDGEELVGAKQNRILNLSILVPRKSEIKIPVSCVEQGRWRHTSRKFKSSIHAQFAKSRAKKARSVSRNMLHAISRHSDQSEIWHDISEKAAKLHARSETDAMADVYNKAGRRLNMFVRNLLPRPGQIGAIFLINGQVSGLDIFDRPKTFAKLSAKIVRSHALDAIEVDTGAKEVDSRRLAKCFLDQIASVSTTLHSAIGLGTDHRIDGDEVTGGALVVNDEVLHISAFPIETEPMDNSLH